ncbi:hypothetical protein ScPMuIL_013690 [Solemya velum]
MVKSSEYTAEFTKTNLEKNVPNYYRCVDYRESRRRQEQLHTPISWDSDSESDPSNRLSPYSIDSLSQDCLHLSLGESEDSYRGSNQSHRIKHKKIQTDTLSQSGSGTYRVELRSHKHDNHNNHNTNQNGAVERSLAQKSSGIGSLNLKPEKVRCQTFVKHKEPRRMDRYRRIPKPCPFSMPNGHPIKKGQRAPFIAYGCSDNELVVGNKRTHNVQASQAVYPAALRAQKRRKSRHRKK